LPGFFAFWVSLGPVDPLPPDEEPPPFAFAVSLPPAEVEPGVPLFPPAVAVVDLVPDCCPGAEVVGAVDGADTVGAVTVGSVATVVCAESPEEPHPAAASEITTETAARAATARQVCVCSSNEVICPTRGEWGGPIGPPHFSFKQ
jgi:hypothetical protein